MFVFTNWAVRAADSDCLAGSSDFGSVNGEVSIDIGNKVSLVDGNVVVG